MLPATAAHAGGAAPAPAAVVEPAAPQGGAAAEAQLEEVELVVAPSPDATATTDGPAGATPAPERTGAPEGAVDEDGADVAPEQPDVGPEQPEDGEAVQADDGPVVLTEADADRVLSPVVETDGFQTLGVTWPEAAAAPELLEVRTRADDGTWSSWTPLAVSDEAPDAGTADARAAERRAGTDPLWVGEADAVQVALPLDAEPTDLSLALVSSPAEEAADVAPAAMRTGGAMVTAAVTAASAPRVIRGSEWGSAGQICRPDVASSLVGAVVHHTAGSNGYATVGQAMQQIRNDQAYHQRSRGWCDLGYNFVVDKWGNIYEGRAGSLDRAVIGVHAGGFNTGTVGVAMLGTYDAAPSAATQQAVGSIIGWRLGAYGVNPGATMSYYTGNGENSRFKNQWVTLPRVIGHRDTAFTSCPGNGGYAALPTIRAVAASSASGEAYRQARAVVRSMYQHLLGRAPEPAGLEDWTARMANGASAADVAAAITRSEEYDRRKIAEAYRSVLGRATDEPGVLSWLAAIRAGTVKIDDIANHLVNSEEFYLRSGGNDAGLVAAMYRSLLGRQGSADEVRYWTSRVPTVGRAGVIAHITGSREAAQRKVQANYQLFLSRYPDIPGQSHWTDVLLVHGEAAVRANILGSEEYRLRAVARYA
ncbi:DUF4214 domain-containing protein [Cellulomonas sp.]|uniref:DUF4214 domain-containing protein n=1 Tax=Cellulomonas sp. TaxID=40001 RepID=UPI002810CF24|nr:DUF4214 domain-containing protein [Cellulomonas sp.]